MKNIAVRDLRAMDREFILSSWLGNHSGSLFARGIHRDLYFQIHAEIIRAILATSKTLVACDPKHTDQIFGYLVYSPMYTQQKFIMHWVCTKEAYQKLGIASALRESMYGMEPAMSDKAPIIASHYTEDAKFLKRKWGIIYNPYVIMGGSIGYPKSM